MTFRVARLLARMEIRSERGQATVEYAGVALLVAALLGAVLAAARPTDIGETVVAKLRCALQDACDGPTARATQSALNPAARAWVLANYRRDPLFHSGATAVGATTALTAGLRQVIVCGAAIGYVVATSVVAPARVVQLVRFVRAVGGVRWAARLLTQATTMAEKLAVLHRVIKEGAPMVLGIEAIREKC